MDKHENEMEEVARDSTSEDLRRNNRQNCNPAFTFIPLFRTRTTVCVNPSRASSRESLHSVRHTVLINFLVCSLAVSRPRTQASADERSACSQAISLLNQEKQRPGVS